MKTGRQPRVGFSGYQPGTRSQRGPVVSLNRLARAVAELGVIDVRNASAWRNDLNVFMVRAPRFTWKPFVVRVDGIAFDHCHTLGRNERLNAPIFSAIDRSAGVFYISEFSRRLIEHFHGTPRQPSIVIHNSTDLAHFSPTGPDRRAGLGWGPDDIVLVASAQWRRWKRLPETLELFRRIKRNFPGRFRLLVLGGGEHEPTDDPDVHYAGGIPSPDLPSWYRTGNLYLHLATLEACGNTQIEAMACGLPVLCANNGGIGETVEGARGGIVSRCDPPYAFTLVDHYHPSPPDYDVLLGDVGRLLGALPAFRAGIDRRALDVQVAARRLLEFLRSLLG